MRSRLVLVAASLLLAGGCTGSEVDAATVSTRPPSSTGTTATTVPEAPPPTSPLDDLTLARASWESTGPENYRFRYYRAAGDWWSVNWDVWVWEDHVVPVLVSATASMSPADVRERRPDGGIDWVWAETLQAVEPDGDGLCSAGSSIVEVDERWKVPEIVWCDDPDSVNDGEGWGVIEVIPLDAPPPAGIETAATLEPLILGMPDVDAIVAATAELGLDQPGRRVVSDGSGAWVTPIGIAPDGVWFHRPGAPDLASRVEVLDGPADHPPRLAGAGADEVVLFLRRSGGEAGISWEVLWWGARSGDTLRVVNPDGWRLDLDAGLLCPGPADGEPVGLLAAWTAELTQAVGGRSSAGSAEEALVRVCSGVAPMASGSAP
jgi:hypothetical protein